MWKGSDLQEWSPDMIISVSTHSQDLCSQDVSGSQWCPVLSSSNMQIPASVPSLPCVELPCMHSNSIVCVPFLTAALCCGFSKFKAINSLCQQPPVQLIATLTIT